jgi:hypothetical protein
LRKGYVWNAFFFALAESLAMQASRQAMQLSRSPKEQENFFVFSFARNGSHEDASGQRLPPNKAQFAQTASLACAGRHCLRALYKCIALHGFFVFSARKCISGFSACRMSCA